MITSTPSPAPGAGSERAPAPQALAGPSDGERVELPLGVSSRLQEIAAEIRAAGAGNHVATYYGAMHDAITAYAAALAPAQGPAAGVAPADIAAPPPGAAPSGNAVLPDLREEIGYWRRDAAARIWSSKALMQAYRKKGRDDLAFAHRDALRAAVSASEEVQAQRWHSSCELCGKPMLPGEATYYFADEGISAHDRCAVEGVTDDTGAPDPTDAEWSARTLDGRLALSDDDQDPAPSAEAPAAGADLAGVEARARQIAADKMGLVKDPIGARLPDNLWRQCLPQAEAEAKEAALAATNVAGLIDAHERACVRYYATVRKMMAASGVAERDVEPLRQAEHARDAARARLDTAIAALARRAHGGSAGVGVPGQSAAVQEVPDDKISALLAIASAARDWAGNDCDPKDWSERALFVALFDAFPEDFPGRENCGCDQSEMACDECPSIHKIRANIAKWRAEGAASRARIEAEDRARPASGATGESLTDA